MDIDGRTSFIDLALESLDFLLLDARRVWVEAAKLLRLLPGQHAVLAMLILVGRHHVLLDRGDIGEIGTRRSGARVVDLSSMCQETSAVGSLGRDYKWCRIGRTGNSTRLLWLNKGSDALAHWGCDWLARVTSGRLDVSHWRTITSRAGGSVGADAIKGIGH